MSLLRLFILCHLRSDAGFGGPGRVLEEGVVVVLLEKPTEALVPPISIARIATCER